MAQLLRYIDNKLIILQESVFSVELLERYDRKATIRRVQQFFLNDRQYPTIRCRSGDWGIRSPQNDATRIHGSRKSNASENSMIEYSEYEQAKQAVDYAIAGCSRSYRHPSQQILKLRYLDGLGLAAIKDRIGKYGNSSYQRADDFACLEFADCIEAAVQRFHVDPHIIPNLHKKQE